MIYKANIIRIVDIKKLFSTFFEVLINNFLLITYTVLLVGVHLLSVESVSGAVALFNYRANIQKIVEIKKF